MTIDIDENEVNNDRIKELMMFPLNKILIC